MGDEKKIDELNKTEKEAIIIHALNREGYNDNQASKLLEVSRSRVCQINKKVDRGEISPIVNSALVGKVKKSLRLLVEGKAVGDMKEVKGSDVLGALKLAAERIDPVTVKTENTNISLSYELKQEDRDKYKKLLGIIDAEYEVIEQKLLPEEAKGISDEVGKEDKLAKSNGGS